MGYNLVPEAVERAMPFMRKILGVSLDGLCPVQLSDTLAQLSPSAHGEKRTSTQSGLIITDSCISIYVLRIVGSHNTPIKEPELIVFILIPEFGAKFIQHFLSRSFPW